MEQQKKVHNIQVTKNGAFCSCTRSRETPDRRDARDWANMHFTSSDYGMLSDDGLNP